MAKVVLAMSGGVDSSVAAELLLKEGHDVIGVFMRHGEQSPVAQCSLETKGGSDSLPILGRLDHKQGCCSATDAEDARLVADRLDIPFYALNLEEEFGEIMDYFAEEYFQGRTPNPCIACNNWIKFGKLFDYADSVGAEYVATGHYARLANTPADPTTEPALLMGIDETKDQSYVLFGIEKKRLHRMLLPVGHFHKSEIRKMATNVGLRVAEKKDSQEICFVTTGKHVDFLSPRKKEETSGEIVTTEGEVIGQHDGYERYTIGQRKGLGIAMGEPYFVVKIEPETRRVIIGKKEALATTELTACKTNWLVNVPDSPFDCSVKIRYSSKAVAARATVLPEGRLRVVFENPCYGVAPGQAVVCYDKQQVLGGGWIE
ncbi:MAG: tRNA 2-thiouridine(34) synthase MnmA [Pirellulaceae bacterium]|nr:tRNA 2-thiouridine(34) synthase MnmA [Pirellulaceae bacterium]